MCLFLLLAAIAPRVAFGFMWLTGDRVETAFDTTFWPFLGLVFAPWTAIAYTLLWSPIVGVSGPEWALVAVAAVVDLTSWTSRLTTNRR